MVDETEGETTEEAPPELPGALCARDVPAGLDDDADAPACAPADAAGAAAADEVDTAEPAADAGAA